MNTGEVIKRVEAAKPGCNIATEEYLNLLNILEEEIYTNIISCHDGKYGFKALCSEEDKLIVPDMYADLYSFWLFARIDLTNGDIAGYTNNMILYNNLMDEFSRYYTRANMPKLRGKVRWR